MRQQSMAMIAKIVIAWHFQPNMFFNNKIKTLICRGYEKFQHGTSRSFVVTHTDNIGPVRKVDLYWEYDMDVLQPRSICFLWCNDHLYVSSVKVEETRDANPRE